MRDRVHLVSLGTLAALFVAGGVAAASLVPERVTFDSLDRDPATGAPVRISALLFRPEGSSGDRHAAVIALHGCGGMYSTLKSRRDDLSPRHQAMAELLVGEGYVVLFPDSFRSRGRDEICTVENRLRTITQVNRRLDTLAALAFMQGRRDVAPDRIAVLGWSHGGSTVLAALNARAPLVAARLEHAPSPPYFRAGVAFYPGCIDSLRAKAGYEIAAPLRLFIGGSDDWTAPQPCVDLAARLAEAGEAVKITVYPDTYHGFDGPTTRRRQRLEVPNGVHPGQGVTVAPNPEARADAYARLKAYLRAELGERHDDGSAGAEPARHAARRQ
ncbi:MAG TPA: dienelactone hydrolase family protein [Casimicrobiaceae bacterium]|nr:dienelactone hydrolase family protein [Casimicrobiaceae bacterium]